MQDVATSFELTAVAPFILMGCILERCGVAERLFKAMEILVGRLPAGVAASTMLMAAIIAATTGIVGAVEVMIGLMAIPVMVRLRYPNDLIAGTICAGGSLGTMVPPSLVLIVYASVANLSVGKLFAAAMAPAAAMIILFIGYILLRGAMLPREITRSPRPERSLWEALNILATGLIPAAFLIFAVLGAILTGIATPTEAASLGCVGAIVLAAVYRSLRWALIKGALSNAILLTAMILLIVVGGALFSAIFRSMGGSDLISELVQQSGLGPNGVVLLMLLVVFIAGFVLEWVSVLLVCIPLFIPLIVANSIDPIWFAMLVFIALQTSYLTPPMAPSIFYLRGIAPKNMTTIEMYIGVLPFILCQLAVLALVFLFPQLVLYLPSILVTGF